MSAVVFRRNFLQWRLLECFMHNYKQNMLCGRDDMRPLGPFGWLDGGVYWFNETLNEVLINASTYDGRFDFTSSLQRRRKELITENLVYRQSLQYTLNSSLTLQAIAQCFPPNSPLPPSVAENSGIPKPIWSPLWFCPWHPSPHQANPQSPATVAGLVVVIHPEINFPNLQNVQQGFLSTMLHIIPR